MKIKIKTAMDAKVGDLVSFETHLGEIRWLALILGDIFPDIGGTSAKCLVMKANGKRCNIIVVAAIEHLTVVSRLDARRRF